MALEILMSLNLYFLIDKYVYIKVFFNRIKFL